jgi:hypothetical protein
MERNEEPLSTRDLASFRDVQADDVVSVSPADSERAASPSATEPTMRPANGATGDARSGSWGDGDGGPLLGADSNADFQGRWEGIQTRFVDDPRRAVEDADGLVATVMHELAESFAQERERLEAQWGRGEDASTEDLRVALQRYRSFFQRLLTT